MGQTTSHYTTSLRPLHTRCRLQKLWGKLNNCREILRENLPGLIAAYGKVTALSGQATASTALLPTSHMRESETPKSRMILFPLSVMLRTLPI